ncbi:MAG: endonuclease I family protein, partial [Phycisphaerae bacterium]
LDPSRIIEIYTGLSVPGVWDAGVTWNREHQWARSLGVGTTGPDSSDLFNLRPADPQINSARGNLPFGTGAGFWDPLHAQALPGVNDRGDVARSMFYMAVRYDGTELDTTDLELVNGTGSGSNLGDLASMLEWHYTDPVDGIEQRRNHLVYSMVDNPTYYQGNRNPFIDHPELVRSIFGDPPNFPFDADGSGVVGLPDLDSFSACLTGPDQPLAYPCDLHDEDGDLRVDLFDFAGYQVLFGN